MKEAFKNNKKVIIIAVAIIVLLSLGITYAYLTTTLHGKEEYMVRAGSLGLRLEESNELTLERQIPIEDSEGMKLDGFNFSLINEGNIDTDFTIYLDDIELDEGETRMPDSAIRYSLTKDSVVGNASDLTSMGVNPNRVVDTGTVAVDETINYTLRIWIDYDATTEEASGKTFKAKLRVETSQHVIPETTKQILANNEVKEGPVDMFNYASNGSYISSFDPEEGPQYGSEPSQVTNGLYSMNDEDGVSYYYRGAVTNNNVQFGEYASDYYVYENNGLYYQSLESCREANVGYEDERTQVKLASQGDKMYWKIVRVNGDGSLRLIYNGTSANPDNSDLVNSFAVGISPYNLESNDPKYTGYTYDNGTDSFIKKEVDTWYKNTLGSSIYDSKVIGGRFCSDSSGYKNASEYDVSEAMFGDLTDVYMYSSMGDRLANFQKNSPGNNDPTLSCPATEETYGGSYRLKAGLITADELTLAGESSYVVGNSYLNPGDSQMWYWSMTPAVFNFGDARVWDEFEVLDRDYVYIGFAVRPVINVTTDDGFTSGDGTASSPYKIS